MPTGYTAPVEDGQITELKDFAANCARAFGAFIHQRDSTGDTLYYPEAPNEDDYHHRSLANSVNDLAEWDRSSEEDKYRLWSEYVEKTIAGREESDRRDAELNARYDAMLDQVNAVDVPEDLQNFKDFMIQQLTDSKYGPYPWRDAPPQEFGEWCVEHESFLRRRVQMDRKYIAEDRERYDKQVRYINLMRETYGFEVKDA